jgi:tyrosine-protein phosphatase YwqE
MPIKLFNIFQQIEPVSDFRMLGTDLNAHLISAIGHNLSTPATTYILRELELLGFQKVIACPLIHINTIQFQQGNIESSVSELKAVIKNIGLKIKLEVAFKYFLDEHLISLLKTQSLNCFYSNQVLIELPIHNTFVKQLSTMVDHGFIPVIANPERCVVVNSIQEFKNLKDIGCKFKVSLLSLSGYYGKTSQKIALELVNKGFTDYLTTDIKRNQHLFALQRSLQKPSITHCIHNKVYQNRVL